MHAHKHSALLFALIASVFFVLSNEGVSAAQTWLDKYHRKIRHHIWKHCVEKGGLEEDACCNFGVDAKFWHSYCLEDISKGAKLNMVDLAGRNTVRGLDSTSSSRYTKLVNLAKCTLVNPTTFCKKMDDGYFFTDRYDDFAVMDDIRISWPACELHL